ncbi:hypothetical protein EDC96DRAFT_576330 [Choanephora cucurbitarum]|nr:hypothetical protein EDC96DRAFT_576330 [Choanephora cucurbitarum]
MTVKTRIIEWGRLLWRTQLADRPRTTVDDGAMNILARVTAAVRDQKHFSSLISTCLGLMLVLTPTKILPSGVITNVELARKKK